MRCPGCGAKNPPDKRYYCIQCGSTLDAQVPPKRIVHSNPRNPSVTDDHAPTPAESELDKLEKQLENPELKRLQAWENLLGSVQWLSFFASGAPWVEIIGTWTHPQVAPMWWPVAVWWPVALVLSVAWLVSWYVKSELTARIEPLVPDWERVHKLRETVYRERVERIAERERVAAQRQQERLLYKAIGAKTFEALSPRGFELAISALLQAKGYRCEDRGGTGDEGVDIRALAALGHTDHEIVSEVGPGLIDRDERGRREMRRDAGKVLKQIARVSRGVV